MNDLIAQLQQLGDAEHDDLSVAHDALEEIIQLRLQLEDAQKNALRYRTLGDRDFAAICAFRYCLGRMTYVVGECVNWLMREWPLLDEHARTIIARDLREEIERDNRERTGDGSKYYPLGHDCDKREWLRLMAHIDAAMLEESE